MKTIIQIILVLLFFDKNTEAQNLIINGDFEQCTKCPEKPGQLNLCPSWYIPNRSTPDLFKECHLIKSYFNIPLNAFGYQASKSGSTYIGLVIIDGVYKNYREYIQGELVETLINEKNYRISFYISWADYSSYFCDRIGYLFTNTKIELGHRKPKAKKKKSKKEPLKPEQLNTVLPTSNGCITLNFDEIKDKKSWHKIEFIYHAKGGERYLTIGLFGDNATEEDYQKYVSKTYGKSSNVGAAAYFYIDDISVVPVDGKIEYTH